MEICGFVDAFFTGISPGYVHSYENERLRAHVLSVLSQQNTETITNHGECMGAWLFQSQRRGTFFLYRQLQPFSSESLPSSFSSSLAPNGWLRLYRFIHNHSNRRRITRPFGSHPPSQHGAHQPRGLRSLEDTRERARLIPHTFFCPVASVVSESRGVPGCDAISLLGDARLSPRAVRGVCGSGPPSWSARGPPRALEA